MLRKGFELPPEAAQTFVNDMRAFFTAKDQLKGDEIAAMAGWRLKQRLPRSRGLAWKLSRHWPSG